MNTHLVFVYGTVRQGGLRSMPELFPGSKFVGHARVSGSLYDLGAHPCLLLDESDSSVIGEVYEIDDEILKELDEIEAASSYGRRRVEVSLGNQRIGCWVYVDTSGSAPRRVLISSGDWIEYAKTKTDWPEEVRPDDTEG
jgi:gamma-glutamylcyclotransferase (GGCT)/AIG2-like uncharacterized protein YtfP